MSAPLWALMRICWAQDPGQRPAFAEICRQLAALYIAPKADDRQWSQMTGMMIHIDICLHG